MDPYCVLELGKKNKNSRNQHPPWRTRTDNGGGKNPKWSNETFSTEFTGLNDPKLQFGKVSVFEEDNANANDEVGSGTFSLNGMNIMDAGEKDLTINLFYGKGSSKKSAGKVYLRVTVTTDNRTNSRNRGGQSRNNDQLNSWGNNSN